MPLTTHLDAHIAKDGFRLRGTHMSRVDGFSDVVFGFALTLLVVSLEVPKTYAELHQILRAFVPFGISFTFLIMLWYAHFRVFRRFGLHDPATILTNAALLFVVLFYVYPLKFLATLLLGGVDANTLFASAQEARELMIVYGLGFAAVYLLFAALYYIGWHHRESLELNSLERTLTKIWIADNLGIASIGILSVLIACILPARLAGLAGFTYFLIIAFKTIHGSISGRMERRARAELLHLQSLA